MSKYIGIAAVVVILGLVVWGLWQKDNYLLEANAHQQAKIERDLLLLDQAVSNSTIKGLSAQVSANSKLLFEERRRASRRQEIMQEAKTIPNPQEVIDYATSKKVLEHLNTGIRPASVVVLRP